MKRHFPILSSIASLAMIGTSSAITIASGTSDTNYRFDTNRGGATFVGAGLDFSGVGLTTSEARWATLLSRNVVISAFHLRPDTNGGGGSNTVTFYSTNDPNGPSHSSTISNAFRVPGSDIFLGVLDNPVPETGYAFYNFTTENINTAAEFTNSSLGYRPDPPGPSTGNQVNTYMVGKQGGDSTTNQWIGRNVTDRWFDDATLNHSYGTVIDDALALDLNNLGPSAPTVTYESILGSGDSGSPLFVESGGELTLAGIGWFVYTSSGTPVGSAYSYVGNYDVEIQNYIDANAIPEPSALVLVSVGGFAVAMRRRRNR